MPLRFLISVIRIFILVFSASQMAIYFLILPVGFLISVIRAFILVISASETVIYFLSLPLRFLISVIPAFILVRRLTAILVDEWNQPPSFRFVDVVLLWKCCY
ncbi:hypothetical protein MiSe_63600 [Microseira wollei NIES-4236]|uniref:Uncharacterized protein n=1 Tax=Microseira wollei NIES-4236 TaxID=2530354 RepID=A0AAV3XIY5_9CYAN|nr:hypothetical protein MiSe_63600 [Microseira wollei NIES-4236]